MKGGEKVVLCIDLAASFKTVRQDCHNKTAGFPDNLKDNKYNFKDILRNTEEKISKSNPKSDSNKALKNEPACDFAADFRIKGSENNRPEEKVKEKETDKKDLKTDKNMTIEEILYALQRMANMPDTEALSLDDRIILFEGIEESLKGLAGIQNESAAKEEPDIHVEFEVLMSALEEIQEAPDTIEIPDAEGADADFIEDFKAILGKISARNETASKEPTNDSIFKQQMDWADVNTEELFTGSTEADGSNDKGTPMQGSDENLHLTADKNMTAIPPEKQGDIPKTEALRPDAKSVMDSSNEAGENEIKSIAGTKAGKETAAVKEAEDGQSRHKEAGDNTKSGGEINKAADAAKNKPVNAEITAFNHKEAVLESKPEVLQNQAPAAKDQSVVKGGIVNQIVKKAEIVVNGSQQEIRMQLEPENLGKLTLKVAVERGLVTAKFVAESHEVKQIIESSFNELRDMLNEKGLAIQNLSVSVGQNKNEYYNGSNQGQFKGKAKLNVRSMSQGSYYGYPDGSEAFTGKANPYSMHTGEFDHRA